MSSLQLKRLSTTGRRSIVPLLGEPILDLTQGILYVGDGITVGGNPNTISEIEKPITGNLTEGECYSKKINNIGQTLDVTLSIVSVTANMSFIFIAGATVANYLRFDPPVDRSIYMNGSTTGNGKYVGLTTVAIGDAIQFESIRTGTDRYDLIAFPRLGSWSQEA